MLNKRKTIFTQIILLTCSSILIVSMIITIISSAISENILLTQVVNNAYTNLKYIQAQLLDYNANVLTAITKINSSSEFKNYITAPINSTLDHINLILDLGKYISTYKDYLSPENSHIIVSGISGQSNRYYSSNAFKWDLLPTDIAKKYMTIDDTIPNKILYHSHKEFLDTVPYQNYIFATKPLIDNGTNTMYGYIAVVIDELNLYAKYSPYVTDGTTISIISTDGTILSSSQKQSISTTNLGLLETATHLANTHSSALPIFSQDKHVTLSLYLPFYDAYLIEEINQRVAFAPLYSIGNYMVIVLIFTLLISLFVIRSLSRKITNPLTKLIHTMYTSSGHDLKKQKVEFEGSLETHLLTEAYNNMIDEINYHVHTLISEQEQRRKAELNALQMQINPHFLYNTLSSIKYLAKNSQIEQVDKTIDCLISMLQNTIGSTDEMISISEELKNLDFYIYINQVRYGDHIHVDYHINEECTYLLIPKLIIQPFVENAFFHAFSGQQSGLISIFITQNIGLLTIEVIDNGIGIDSSENSLLAKKHRLSGIGIHNVDDRIKLLYGSAYGIHIQSDKDFGTSITITLPTIQS